LANYHTRPRARRDPSVFSVVDGHNGRRAEGATGVSRPRGARLLDGSGSARSPHSRRLVAFAPAGDRRDVGSVTALPWAGSGAVVLSARPSALALAAA